MAAGLAIFGLYLQLAAVTLCLANSSADALAELSASPICHAQDRGAGDDGSGQPAHAAAACPFCSLHAHAGTLVAPPPALIIPAAAMMAPARPPRFAALPPSRCLTDAAPRGPPTAG